MKWKCRIYRGRRKIDERILAFKRQRNLYSSLTGFEPAIIDFERSHLAPTFWDRYSHSNICFILFWGVASAYTYKTTRFRILKTEIKAFTSRENTKFLYLLCFFLNAYNKCNEGEKSFEWGRRLYLDCIMKVSEIIQATYSRYYIKPCSSVVLKFRKGMNSSSTVCYLYGFNLVEFCK